MSSATGEEATLKDRARPVIPAVYVSTPPPTAAVEDDDYASAMERLGQGLPKPDAVVVVTSRWVVPGTVRVSSTKLNRILKDLNGFPRAVTELDYSCPGDPQLATEVVALLTEAGTKAFPDQVRGLDHAAWIPLRFLFPEADVPVVQMSVPANLTAQGLMDLGAALSRLRQRGVMLLGCGGSTPDPRHLQQTRKHAMVEEPVRQFDLWLQDHLDDWDLEALAAYRSQAPAVEQAIADPKELAPLFLVLGSAREGERVATVYEGYQYASISLRCFVLT